jgi:ribosomal protein S18 acetylase RimI-like enzyme
MQRNTKLVEMICGLSDQTQNDIELPAGFNVNALIHVQEDELYPCYLAAFRAGDSKLFFKQGQTKQREFFETLAFDQARNEPGSLVIMKEDQIIGFTYLVPYGETNRHISCMCVHPDFQRQGLGSFMLEYAKNEAYSQGYRSITLWTEAAMGAFELYRKHGFMITEEKAL